MLPIPLSPQPLKNTAIYSVFFNFSMFQPSPTYIQEILAKHCVWQCFSNVSCQTDGNLHVFCHKGSKSFQNIAFDSVFVMFPVKHTVIYTFFAITSVQNTCFCSVCNALASKNPAKSCYVQSFFHFWPFFHCRKATKMTQNSVSIPSWAQTPKNPRKMSKTPPYSGLGAKPFLAPPLAKADIATAILTNVIEHLVLLLPPNKHAFTAKAVWADLGPQFFKVRCLKFTGNNGFDEDVSWNQSIYNSVTPGNCWCGAHLGRAWIWFQWLLELLHIHSTPICR